MPSELQMQKETVDAVRTVGGFAHKMSNRFLIGVADLLIKLPQTEHPAMVLEVKINKLPLKTKTITLNVSPLQERYLCDAAAAGMPAGVLSFVKGPNRMLMVSMMNIADAFAVDYKVNLEDRHVTIPLGQRGPVILKVLQDFAASHEAVRT